MVTRGLRNHIISLSHNELMNDPTQTCEQNAIIKPFDHCSKQPGNDTDLTHPSFGQTVMGMDKIVNSLAPGRSWCDFKNVIFNLVLLVGIFKFSYDNVLRWMPQDLTDDKSTLGQVMAWCRQASSHYLDQCWPRSPTPYGVTRPEWVKGLFMGNHDAVKTAKE